MVTIKESYAAKSLPTELLSAIPANNKIHDIQNLVPFMNLKPECFELSWNVTVHRVEKCPVIQMHYVHYTIGQKEQERDVALLSPRELGDIAKQLEIIDKEDLCYDKYVLRGGKDLVSWIDYTKDWNKEVFKKILKYRIVKTLLLQANNHWFVSA